MAFNLELNKQCKDVLKKEINERQSSLLKWKKISI